MKGALVLVTLTALVVAGCSSNPSTTVPSPPGPTYADGAPGSLVDSSRFSTADMRIGKLGGESHRITYRSTSGVDGSPTVVTGSVFTPPGLAPEGGWNIVAYGHGTTGMLEDCAPSMYPHLIGNAGPVAALVNNGYVVVMPDYQGLGSDGPHPYLEPRTVGFNMIDSVRATRELVPDTSAQWAAFGGSQGGQASWAANELQQNYGAGLDLVGAVALAPAANMSGLATDAFLRALTPEQLPLMQFAVNSLAQVYPDIVLSDYLHGDVLANNDALLQCAGTALETRNQLAESIVADDVAPSSPESAQVLADRLTQWSLPLAPGGPGNTTGSGVGASPMLVVQGDEDNLVRWTWTLDAVRRACERGDVIDWRLRPGEGHGDLDTVAAFAWMADRFAAEPVADSCTSLVGPSGAEALPEATSMDSTEPANPVDAGLDSEPNGEL